MAAPYARNAQLRFTPLIKATIMRTGRDTKKDNMLFDCNSEQERHEIAELYSEKEKIKKFLLEQRNDPNMPRYTHYMIYLLIKVKLGFPIPN